MGKEAAGQKRSEGVQHDVLSGCVGPDTLVFVGSGEGRPDET